MMRVKACGLLFIIAISARPAVSAPASTTKSGNRRSAEAANARGMKEYRAKDYSHAAREFLNALAADSTYAMAHYNLACVSALLGDKKTAIAELQWLSARSDAVARSKLVKSKTDPDLKSVINDPEVQKLLDATSPRPCDCKAARDKCEQDCPDDGTQRACGRSCGSDYDDCVAKCDAK